MARPESVAMGRAVELRAFPLRVYQTIPSVHPVPESESIPFTSGRECHCGGDVGTIDLAPYMNGTNTLVGTIRPPHLHRQQGQDILKESPGGRYESHPKLWTAPLLVEAPPTISVKDTANKISTILNPLWNTNRM